MMLRLSATILCMSLSSRGDHRYKGGPAGGPLGPAADAADIQDFAKHALDKGKKSSRFTSFTTDTKVARKFPAASDNRYVSKAQMDKLRELEAENVIKIHTPDSVYDALKAAGGKLAKEAVAVRDAMRKTGELLIEGQIPDGVLGPTN